MKASVKATLGKTNFYTEIVAGENKIITDEPVSLGGENKGFNPLEVLASSLASCTAATLEDYSGSFSFRLGDKDYMRLRDKLDLHRFIILRFRFTISRDGRVFINVTDAFDLLDAFDLFAKKISFLVSPEKLTRGDVEFLRELIAQYEGEKPISFYIENTSQGNNLETKSTIGKLEIQKDLVKKLKDYQHIPFFLN